MKTCTRCKEVKPLSEFGKQTKTRDGLSWSCKACQSVYAAAYRATDKGKIAVKLSRKKYAANGRSKASQIKWRYGLSESEYAALLAENTKCAICGGEFGARGPMIDHCHSSMKVRGVICQSCNSMLGYAKDNPTTLAKAIVYLCETTPSLGGSNACGEESSDAVHYDDVKLASVKQEVAGLRRDAQTL